ncbi:MAG: MBL fold metallo-hydrolase [Eubacterium sp.]|nr:MBL fold metallo-hydrolase [Eubacterium sp.]
MYKMTCRTQGPVATNCYTVINEDTNEAILVDASGSTDSLLSAVKDAGAKLVAVLLTHAHFDHVDAVEKVRDIFPEVQVYIGVNDEKLLSDPGLNLSLAFMGNPVSVKSDNTVSDGEEIELIGLKIRCIEVPGHTIGGMCYYIESLGTLFDGDTLFHGSIGRSDFPTGNGEDLIKNIEDKLLVLPEETKVFPGHDSETTIGREKTSNYYFI